MTDFGIDSLKFFDTEGREIIMQKQYSASWEIVPADQVFSAFLRNPKGHFEMMPEDIISWNNTDDTDNVDIQEHRIYTLVLVGTLEDILLSNKIEFFNNSTNIPISYNAIDFDLPGFEYETVDDNGYTITTIKFTSDFFSSNSITKFSAQESNKTYRSVSSQSTIAIIVVDEPGMIYKNVRFALKDYDENQLFNYTRTSDNEDDIYETVTGTAYNDYEFNNVFDILFFSLRYKDYNARNWYYSSNKVVITVYDGQQQETVEYRISDIFRSSASSALTENLIEVRSFDLTQDSTKEFNTTKDANGKISQWTESDTTKEVYGITENIFEQVFVPNSSFDDLIELEDPFINSMTTVYYMMSYNIPTNQFPYVKYVGTYYLEKTSVDFISTATVIVVSETETTEMVDNEEKTTYSYTYPDIKDETVVSGTQVRNETYRMHFRFAENSEMKFITYDD